MKCRRCNRPLKAPLTVINGIGNACLRKERAERQYILDLDFEYKPLLLPKGLELGRMYHASQIWFHIG